jgi:hypothetical protein
VEDFLFRLFPIVILPPELVSPEQADVGNKMTEPGYWK